MSTLAAHPPSVQNGAVGGPAPQLRHGPSDEPGRGKRPPFGAVDHAILKDRRKKRSGTQQPVKPGSITDRMLSTYIVLLSFSQSTGECNPSNGAVADKLGLKSAKDAGREINRVARAGLIQLEKAPRTLQNATGRKILILAEIRELERAGKVAPQRKALNPLDPPSALGAPPPSAQSAEPLLQRSALTKEEQGEEERREEKNPLTFNGAASLPGKREAATLPESSPTPSSIHASSNPSAEVADRPRDVAVEIAEREARAKVLVELVGDVKGFDLPPNRSKRIEYEQIQRELEELRRPQGVPASFRATPPTRPPEASASVSQERPGPSPSSRATPPTRPPEASASVSPPPPSKARRKPAPQISPTTLQEGYRLIAKAEYGGAADVEALASYFPRALCDRKAKEYRPFYLGISRDLQAHKNNWTLALMIEVLEDAFRKTASNRAACFLEAVRSHRHKAHLRRRAAAIRGITQGLPASPP